MKKYTLSALKRVMVGRKVKKLREEGQLPATVYGKNVKSATITVPLEAFISVYGSAGETGLIELSLEGAVRPVLIHNVQKDPVLGHLLHVEFFQVDLKEKVHTNVPLEVVGEAPAVAQKLGVLLTVLDEVEVEALPTDLPEKITVDVSQLGAVGQELKVSDLKLSSGVTLLTDGGLTVVKIGELVSKEAEAQAAEEAAQAAAAAAEVPGEGAAPADAQTPENANAQEKPSEEKPQEK